MPRSHQGLINFAPLRTIHTAQAPALTWLSFGGSRFCRSRNALDIDDDSSPSSPTSPPWWRQGPLPVISLQELERGEELGNGASGDVYRARWSTTEVALKLFRGDTGPDGRSIDEIEVLCMVDHPGLTKGAFGLLAPTKPTLNQSCLVLQCLTVHTANPPPHKQQRAPW